MFSFYILKSLLTGKYYIGSTEDINVRLEFHNSGKVRSTKSDVPWILVYLEEYKTRNDARKRELQIKKRKSRKAIEALMKNI